MMLSQATEPQPAQAANPAAPPRRRRLWQLPAEHRACVVGLGVPPSVLRRAVEQALTRLHRVRVELTGSDADLLASVLCDLGSRNAVSEAVQDLLDLRHAAAGARVAGWRQPEALREVWRAALAGGGDVPGLLWALLTHSLGESLQDALAVDARGWVFERARAGQAACAAEARAQHDIAAQRAEADALRHRVQAQQAAFDAERQALAQQLARLRGECDALRAAAAVAPQSEREARPAPVCRSAPPLTPVREAPGKALAMPAPAAPAPEMPMLRPTLRGRLVLCVGGMPGAQARYRELVEAAGARFDYHDGGLEQGLHRLDRQLGAADVVVCQAACLNHEAYRRVKSHCRASTKTCLFVERPSLANFARKLGLAAATGARP
jgi:hypothetical protein